MRTLALDVTRLVGRALKGRVPTGIDRVGIAYVRHMRDRARALLRIGSMPAMATRESSDRLFAQLLEAPAESARGRWKLVEAASRLVPELAPAQGALLLHTGHGGLEKPDFLGRWQRSGGRAVAFVHDLIPLTHPEYARHGEREKHAARMHAVLTQSAAIIVNSAATRRELEGYATRVGHTAPRTVVAHLGTATLPAPSHERPIAGPYFVVVGTIEGRKNHLLLLQLWRRMVERGGKNLPKLVIIGQRGWECESVVDMLDRCEALRGVVIEKPGASDADLATYMHHAQALLFPSFVEGYGLPLVEALSAGVPVVASTLSVFRELAGDLPAYVDPLDGPGWLARIDALSSPLAARKSGSLQGFHAPTWANHFATVDALLESLS